MAAEAAPPGEPPVEHKSRKALVLLNAKKTRDLFAGNFGKRLPTDEARCCFNLSGLESGQVASSKH